MTTCGDYCIIDKTATIGKGVSLGHFVIIEPNVVIQDNVKIGNKVTLKSGTFIAANSIVDDHCITTGACYIGRNVNIRTGAIISMSTIIEDDCFIGPGVITNHTKHVDHARPELKTEKLLTYISYGSIIGSQASLLAGIHIGPQSIVGGGSVVPKSLEGYGVYVGSPCRKISDLPAEFFITTEPEQAGQMYLTHDVIENLKKYLPNLIISKQ